MAAFHLLMKRIVFRGALMQHRDSRVDNDLRIIKTKEKGRCVVADRDFKSGEMIDENHVVRVDYDKVKESQIEPYCMDWGSSDAIAFGKINLINHSTTSPNTRIERDMTNDIIRCFAVRDIAKGEELTFTYNCEPWFVEV